MELRNSVFVAMETTLPQQQKFVQVMFRSLHPSAKSQRQGFNNLELFRIML